MAFQTKYKHRCTRARRILLCAHGKQKARKLYFCNRQKEGLVIPNKVSYNSNFIIMKNPHQIHIYLKFAILLRKKLMQARRNCQKMLYEPQSYKSYLEHRKSHQLLSTVMAENTPVAQEWMGQERFSFILKWFIWTWLKPSITLCMIQSSGRVNSLPVTGEFRFFFSSSQLLP